MSRGFRLLGIAALLLCLMSAAGAESARVLTPGGKLNMRKSPDDKAKLVDSVPNRALVEVVEESGEWTKITYKKQSGYAKTEFLKLPSQLPGKTVYADEGALPLLRSEANADAMIVAPIGSQEAMTVSEIAGEWAKVSCAGREGWVETLALSYQLEEPAAGLGWISEAGAAAKACPVRAAADDVSREVFSLEMGEPVTVTVINGKYCFIMTEAGCGYAPVSAVSLAGPQDSEERLDDVSPNEAALQAEAALKKKFKAFAKEKVYCVCEVRQEQNGLPGPLYACGFFNNQDQYLYGALVNAAGQAFYIASYADFAAPVREKALLPQGQVQLSLSQDQLAVGEILDVTVAAWTDYCCQYTLSSGGKQLAVSEAGPHFQASFRPRTAGSYLLKVTVTDENGTSVTEECTFTVETYLVREEEEEESAPPIYSQKDGWWADKKYRHSNLGKSGCAIFALSHALQRLGWQGDEVQPETLAATYSYCLIKEEGTNNTLLINNAGRDFGFVSQTALINDEKRIAALLKNGVMFSFSPARGHIAMVSGISEDGAMVRVVDSAPGATFERIVNASLYYPLRSGSFRAALSLEDIPGARWYLETEDYGGLEYYLPMSYVAKRGVRLIQPRK